MDFDYEELWEESRSEFDCLMDETIEKIKNLILGRVKDEVEEILHRADEEEAKVKRLEEIIRNQDKKRKELEKEIKELKDKTDANRFNYGDTVFFVDSVYKLLKCPECNGSGIIELDTPEYGKITRKCSKCNGKGKTSYQGGKIISFDVGSILYGDKYCNYSMEQKRLLSSKEDAQEELNKFEEESKKAAEKELYGDT